MKGLEVTSYPIVDATTRVITGTAEIDGAPGTYEVVVSDWGEPGRDDTFTPEAVQRLYRVREARGWKQPAPPEAQPVSVNQ